MVVVQARSQKRSSKYCFRSIIHPVAILRASTRPLHKASVIDNSIFMLHCNPIIMRSFLALLTCMYATIEGLIIIKNSYGSETCPRSVNSSRANSLYLEPWISGSVLSRKSWSCYGWLEIRKEASPSPCIPVGIYPKLIMSDRLAESVLRHWTVNHTPQCLSCCNWCGMSGLN